MKRLIGFLILAVAFMFPSFAEARSYQYDSIKIDYSVNADSTVFVTESQIFNYSGLYNKGWRSISHKGVDAVTDISVWDGATGKELSRSFFDLDKTDPSSWGKYHVSKNPESTDVSWYYNMEDTTHEWIVKYKLHGAISFLDDRDELYWNAIGDQYEVPIGAVEVRVHIPEGAIKTGLSSAIYIDGGNEFIAAKDIINERTFEFSAANVPSGSFVTIAAGWPKGLVDRAAFWRDFFIIYWQWPAAIFPIIGFIILWKIMKKRREDWKGVIVPQYEPPGGIKPAMANILLYGYSGSNALPATIIDLAVRGYVTIESRKKIKEKINEVTGAIIKAVISLFFLIVAFSAASSIISVSRNELMSGILKDLFSEFMKSQAEGLTGDGIFALVFAVVFLIIVIRLIWSVIANIGKIIRPAKEEGIGKEEVGPEYYVVRRTTKEVGDDVEDYERSVMEIIFKDGDFDTEKIDRYSSDFQETSRKLIATYDLIKKETEKDTGAFEKKQWTAKRVGVAVIGAIVSIIAIMSSFAMFVFQPFFAVVISGTAVTAMIWMFSARYTLTGKQLHEEWLGFKMYLKTAEKYRLRNLTPDLFEKYLPYAMIFGLEDKWAKAFEGMTVKSPDWYAGSSSVSLAHGVSSGGFSPSSFTSGFSNSFSSLLSSATGTSSSGGSGGSGGGGSSGGGGGGGGGGAS